MNLKSYLDLYALLKNNRIVREKNRAFGLTHVMVKNKPLEQLLAWVDEHKPKLKKPRLSEIFSSYLYSVTIILCIIAFIVGFLSGIALLSYSGHEPVNVIYFMAMVVFFPLFTMMLTFISMIKANSTQSLLVHISPAFWMERIIRFLPNKMQKNLKEVRINPLLANWLVIKRSQIIALVFSMGLLFALLGMIATKDIAFAWSTTLHVTPESFHRFLNTLAFPWREWFPSAVPSVELIEQSQYFRLGEKLDTQMIQNAFKLGEWWKFLAFATLFYAIILRFMMYLSALFCFKQALKRSFLTLDGVNKLLREMNEPVISTHSDAKEESFMQEYAVYGQTIHTLDASYDIIQGWSIPKKQLEVMGDSMQVISPRLFEVGGGNTLEEDREIIHGSHGEVLLYVKAWEPPTMDFVDFLEALLKQVDKVIICPAGTPQEHYRAEAKAIEVWARKLMTIDNDKIWLKQ
ncbi:MAG: hypothetical protein P794_08570 [Epsilonproteobacteria bacterium (ex Lamellibrachia satsuma)]|nr:MAG: hypothetical protein P794_08570 [Epsilonproteobacteria bacterium (ex Lamellibrachia satsuma)]